MAPHGAHSPGSREPGASGAGSGRTATDPPRDSIDNHAGRVIGQIGRVYGLGGRDLLRDLADLWLDDHEGQGLEVLLQVLRRVRR